MSFLAELQAAKLRTVRSEDVQDRSSANLSLSKSDVIENEDEVWKYFFESGCDHWFSGIQEYTFRSSFIDLHQNEAEAIVDHWLQKQRMVAAAASYEKADVDALTEAAMFSLEALCSRLDAIVAEECKASAAGKAFVKLSTRSPKDSKKALARAEKAYLSRIQDMSSEERCDDNLRWKILSEEVTRAGAVTSGSEALELLLDSERVFEDLEFALRGPKATGSGEPGKQAYKLSLVARAWDPRLTLQSEFRGIVWNGKLTCLNQYFHPLFFPELLDVRDQVVADCQKLFEKPAVTSTVKSLGGHCIIDFAWLAPNDVIIVELNPFDGMCLGTFPASTGLFLWDDDNDRSVMTGEQPFEMRIRTSRLPTHDLKNQCNPDWRRIIYEETCATR